MNDIKPIRIFVGTSPNGEDAEAEMVLDYSLRKHSSRPLDITWMRLSRESRSLWYGGWGGWNTRKWPTPFSGFRWSIPEACDYQGKAIYMDVDMINLQDISVLYDLELDDDKAIMARPGVRWGYEFCVMLMDCEKLKASIPPIRRVRKHKRAHRRIYDNLLASDVVQPFDSRWNCLDGEAREINDIWQLHYTNMASQPWQPEWYWGTPEPHERPEISDLWFQYREEAIAHNFWPKKPEVPFGRFNIHGVKKG